MEKIITSYCGNCETELYKEYGTSEFCGETHIECTNCGTMNKTGNKPYSMMNSTDVFNKILSNFVYDIIFLVSGGGFILSVYSGAELKTTLVFGVIFIIYNGIKVLILLNHISKIEKNQEKINIKLKEK